MFEKDKKETVHSDKYEGYCAVCWQAQGNKCSRSPPLKERSVVEYIRGEFTEFEFQQGHKRRSWPGLARQGAYGDMSTGLGPFQWAQLNLK